MERIIITEVDNTSNVESLSSYDVVYVPGFSNNGTSPVFTDSQTLFRTPTLCTTKYEFLKLYGSTCPTFTTDQPYPIATAATESSSGTYGFPSYAIPGYVPPVTPTAVELNSFELDSSLDSTAVIAAIENDGYYTDGFVATSSWTPEDDVVYYMASSVTGDSTTTWTMYALTEADSYEGLYIFTSSINPNEQGWKILYNNQYYYTDDTYLDFNTSGSTKTTVKTYYVDESTPALMFQGATDTSDGDADPGYRYALYLLSLGIPVYYEQMNSDFAEVDMNDPLNLAKVPKDEDWFVLVGTDYVRTDDTEVDTSKTYYLGADMSVESMYKGLENRFFAEDDEEVDYTFDSMGDYSIKYITSGGYPVFEYGPLADADSAGYVYGTSPLAEAMIQIAEARKDAVALIDHTNNPFRSIYETDTYSVVTRVRDEFADLGTVTGSYGTMFTPWYTCTHNAITGGSTLNYSAQMPASLGYLSALAQQLRNYNPWLAVSGVSRGTVPYCASLHTNFNLTNNVADSYQLLPSDTEASGAAVSINPITYIRNYGYCVWGNRTLRNNSSGTQSTSFLNIRNLVSDIKKQLYDASLTLMFEQNTDVLWINFKSLITPLLSTMVSNYILSDYTITRYLVDPDTGATVPAYKVLANIRIQPINSVEVFDLQVTLENSELTVSETE